MPTPEGKSIPELLDFLRSSRPTSPRLIWYGDNHERIELSGKVLDNWVAKTSNLLVDELDAEPGQLISLQLPPHWKAVIWALACWQTGCIVSTVSANTGSASTELNGREPLATVVSTDEALTALAELGSAGGIAVAVAPGALQPGWSGELPVGALDYAADVRSHGDVFFVQGQAEETDPALDGASGQFTYASLFECERPAPPLGANLLVQARNPNSLDHVLRQCLAVWAADGCVVLAETGLDLDPGIINSEKISSHPGFP